MVVEKQRVWQSFPPLQPLGQVVGSSFLLLEAAFVWLLFKHWRRRRQK